MNYTEVEPQLMADYFGKTLQNMHQLKRKFELGESELWGVYVDAYLYRTDTEVRAQLLDDVERTLAEIDAWLAKWGRGDA